MDIPRYLKIQTYEQIFTYEQILTDIHIYVRAPSRVHDRTDSGSLEECKCAMIETLWDFCPGQKRQWWPSTAQIATKILYLPGPDPVVYVVPLSNILGRLPRPLVPAGNTGTIPYSMRNRKEACYEYGICDRDGEPGSGSPLFCINSWAMIWPTDHAIDPA